MPVNPTYPGVYVEELPSSTHTVSGVSTSSTAFGDFFARGPVGQAVQITSFRDFDRIYGGLHPRSESSYGLLQYFNNGGQIAWIVRAVTDSANIATCSVAVVTPTVQESAQDAAAAAAQAQAAADTASKVASQIQSANAGLQIDIVANQTQVAADGARTAGQATSTAANLSVDANAKKSALTAAGKAVDAANKADAAVSQLRDALAALDGATSVTDLNNQTSAAAKQSADVATAAAAAATAAADAANAAGQLKTSADAATAAAQKAATDAKAATPTGDAAKDAAAAAQLPKLQAAATDATNAAAAIDAAATAAQTAATSAKTASDAAAQAVTTAQKAAADAAASTPESGETLAAQLQAIADATSKAAAAAKQAAQATESAGLELSIAIEQQAAEQGVVGAHAQATAFESAEAAQNAAAAAQAAAAAADAAAKADPANLQQAQLTMEAAVKAAAAAAAAASVAAGRASDATIAEQQVKDDAEPVQLVVSAANPGAWGNSLRISINESISGFDLYVQQVRKVSGKLRVIASETYRQLTLDDQSPRYAVAVVNDASTLVNLDYKGTHIAGAHPENSSSSLADNPANGQPLTGGADGDVAGASDLLDQVTAALDHIAPSIFNLLCLPGTANYSDNEAKSAITQAITYCTTKRAMFLVDVPARLTTTDAVTSWTAPYRDADTYGGAVYFPRLVMPDPLQDYRPRNVPASGTMAGIYARTDTARGVWKAPAGIEAAIQGADLAVLLTDQDSGQLNPLGINVLRSFPVYGSVVWGARTLAGADQIDSQWKYINVRRLADYIEESLFQSLKWVVFEPNTESTWSQIRLEVNSFLAGLFAGGAFQGATPDQAFFVHCDSTTTTPADINSGIVNIIVGFAPSKPAEFVILQIEQIAGQTS